MQFKERAIRSFVKAISYRCFGTMVTMAVVYWQTHALALSLGAGVLDFFAKIFLFYIHERVWNLLNWGKKEIEPAVIWFTGLSGAGKSTLAEKLRSELQHQGYDVQLLDGDEVRTFFKDTGFSREERLRHLKCMGFIASKLEQHGTIVISSFITPYEEARIANREICKKYIEVYVSTSLEDCEKRDPKGLYQRARKGEINHFTGISSPFESPTHADIILDTGAQSIDQSFQTLAESLKTKLPGLKDYQPSGSSGLINKTAATVSKLGS